MKEHSNGSGLAEVIRSITIGKPADELYRFWRNPVTLREITSEMFRMTPTGTDHARWKTVGPVGTGMEWDAEITEDVPGRAVTWGSIDASTVRNDLRIAFSPAPGDQGTEAQIVFRFDPPGGMLGEAATKLFGIAPEMLVAKLLRRLKARVETGEMPTLEFNSAHRPDADKPGEQK